MKTIIFQFIFLIVSMCVNAQTGVISTYAGNGMSGDSGDGGQATAAKISGFTTGAFDNNGNFYFAERGQHKIRKISSSGIISTIAGVGTSGFLGDGGPATLAQLNNPLNVAVDNSGNLYFADLNNSRVRKVDLVTGIITTIAGNGTDGHSGDGGIATSASLDGPTGVCVDPSGSVFTSEISSAIIRKITTSGIISTYAGTPYSGVNGGDGGPATAATISAPQGICSDKNGNIYIACAGKVRKVTASSGIINSVAGGDINGFSGDGGPSVSSLLNSPWSVAVDNYNNIFIADGNNNRIRFIDKNGIIGTIAGNGVAGFYGDGGSSNLAQINQPEGVALDSCGNIYISDLFNFRIRKVVFSNCHYLEVNETIEKGINVSIHPNPATTHITITTTEKINTITITNMQGQSMHSQVCNGIKEARIDIAHLPPGMYLVRVNDVWVQRFMKE